jgi:PTS system nitrogen regulatory IIA component
MAQDTAQLLTVDDVARMLRVSKAAVYRWAEDGKIRARKAGTLLRFRVEDVEDFLRSTD